ncbi:unnamed protein product [Adineta steineri]|uniref:LIM zinc-binding domain-containing protein n=1 Tax=Adineta steineri TaxID=433720 RepID=A0A814KCL9_9BILA|nr:unnamed protein product [Adineta steineri]CAF3927465.1 unnamed protein product [Adineta steineri]
MTTPHFCDRCATCGKSFGRTEARTIFNNKTYHQNCLKCAKCRSPLSGNFYPTLEGFTCEQCHKRVSTRCKRCGNTIESGIRYKLYKGQEYHPECFCCWSCNSLINEGEQFYELRGYPQCPKCHSEGNQEFADYQPVQLHQCVKCKKTIEKVQPFSYYEDNTYHNDCFVCNRCGLSLVDKPCTRLGSAVVCPNCN